MDEFVLFNKIQNYSDNREFLFKAKNTLDDMRKLLNEIRIEKMILESFVISKELYLDYSLFKQRVMKELWDLKAIEIIQKKEMK